MNHKEIRERLKAAEISGDEIFALTRSVAYFYQKPASDNVEALDLIIRLIDRRAEFDQKLSGVATMIDAIAREAGLYPYIATRGGWHDEIAIELMRAPGLSDVIFHIEQAMVFHKLAEGRSIILSAPTSFGKSLLIDVLIAYRQPKTIIAVVPTIALLDEFRRRLEKKFPNYQVITRSQEQRINEYVIYIGTQERLLERAQISEVDLFIIDEFYKLDLDRNDKRSLALNAVLAKYGKISKQLYFLGPSIDDVPNATSFRTEIEFIKTQYSPVTADIIDRTNVGPSPSQLIEDLKSVGRSSSLIYVQSPPATSRLVSELIKSKLSRRSRFCSELSDWLAESFHPEWILPQVISRGIGIHHGRIPRSIANLIISMFNQGELAVIICTSSMIEGINTAAENVFIYDKNINTTKLDRFTFDNIKGRAGRMFQHNIGKIFMYNDPPDQTQFDVRIPLFDADELMAPELLIQIQDESLTPTAQRRKRAIIDVSELPSSVLSAWAEFGIDNLNNLAKNIKEKMKNHDLDFIWSGVPDFNQIEATFDLVWKILHFPKHDIRTPRQLALYADRLRRSSSVREYLNAFVTLKGLDAQPEIDRCFNFMRGAEYTFPQLLRAANDIIDSVSVEGIANYRVYAAELQNLFLSGELRALDEFGVPLPLIQRLSSYLPVDDIDASRRQLASPNQRILAGLSKFEIELLSRGLS